MMLLLELEPVKTAGNIGRAEVSEWPDTADANHVRGDWQPNSGNDIGSSQQDISRPVAA